jgi:cytochrome oxidase Cu insertion factor (SCO1/SenC/PrrC family)
MLRIGGVKGALAISAAGLAAASLITLWILGGSGRISADLAPTANAIGGSFQLTSADGRSVSDRDFRGKWLLVYFGYTHCPDICPTTLAEISQTLGLLGDDAARFQPLFISIDPQRDTPQIVGEYVKEFDDRIIGLAGTPEEIAAAAKAYRVFYAKQELADANNYLMQHTAFVYVMGPDGGYVTLLSPLEGQTPDVMASRLRELVSQAQTEQTPSADAAPRNSLSPAVAVSPRGATPPQ